MHAAKTLYARFDALALLIHEVSQYPDDANAHQLKNQALNFAMAIVDAKNTTELVGKIKQRNAFKKNDPEYMPWNIPTVMPAEEKLKNWQRVAKKIRKYRLVNAESAKTDQVEGVKYFNQQERETYRIFPADGRFKKIIEKDNQLQLIDFDTSSYSADNKNNRAIFIISPRGDFFAASTRYHSLHHSSFLAGAYTFFSGAMTVTTGELKYCDDSSGHYKPKERHNIQALSFLRKANLLTESSRFGITNSIQDKRIVYDVKSPALPVLETRVAKLIEFKDQVTNFLKEHQEHPLIKAGIEQFQQVIHQKKYFSITLDKRFQQLKEFTLIAKKILSPD